MSHPNNEFPQRRNPDSDDDLRRDASPPPDGEPTESLDSVPDSHQEQQRLDAQTQKLLDSMDDEGIFRLETELPIQPERQEMIQAQPDRLERLASAVYDMQSDADAQESDDDWKAGNTPPTDHIRETSDGVPDNMQEGRALGGHIPTPSPDDLPPDAYYYRLVATLPDDIETQITEALASIEVTDSADGLQLQAPFQAVNLASVFSAIEQWAHHYLPLDSGLSSVHSEVRGAQQYVAGWRLTNATPLHQAQNDLTTRLAGIAIPAPNTSATFRPIIGLLTFTPAEKFPQLVAHLHQHFITTPFTIQSVSLLRMPLPNYQNRVSPEKQGWHLYKIFAT